MDKNLKLNLFGQTFNNPIILASGVLGTTVSGLKRAIDAGAGAVTTKSLGLHSRTGHSPPCVVEVDGGYLNAMGLPNPGVQAFTKELNDQPVGSAPLIGSVYGKDKQQFGECAQIIARHVDIVELNLSCPHAQNLGTAIGSDPGLVEGITSNVRKEISRPLLVKLTPNVTDIVDIGLAAQNGGADGIVAINTVRGMTIDIDARRPVLGNRFGGLSGPAIHPITVGAVYELYDKLDIPIIGVGGIDSGEKAVEILLAGATAIEIGTAVGTEGLSVFDQINRSIADYLTEQNLTLGELTGKAHH